VTARWQDNANCRGVEPALFFPGRGGDTGPALDVCRGCTVRAECLAEALDQPERFGIWGGMSERERRAIRKARRAGLQVATA
jgi:WhiB family redox-sensing transcriptional regulator